MHPHHPHHPQESHHRTSEESAPETHVPPSLPPWLGGYLLVDLPLQGLQLGPVSLLLGRPRILHQPASQTQSWSGGIVEPAGQPGSTC